MKFLTYLGYGLASAVLFISVNACMKTPEAVTSAPKASSSLVTTEPQLKQDNPAAATTIGTTLADLTKAWPTAVAPATPVKTSDEVTKLIKSIELETQKLAKTAA
jgi:hypothetical protein